MSHRPAMLGTVIRALIAPVLRECPPACGIVSITAVDVSSDSSYATVMISALREPERALEFLNGRKNDLQRLLSKLPRRKIPMLRFRIDRSGERGARMDELLRSLGENPERSV
ncbi:ribosome-binding factor A [Candidatus Peregrinibacteria bacterium]|nr:ribosome-binding factor A [Candidatus Peregrinibacteria bacterium]MBI3816257.1 ribosome-binding factor A [Candidatus Peregrinibacteria bacterium]